MEKKLAYPLKEVIEVKQKRVDDAEKVVKEKKAALETEKQKLEQKEKERDVVKKHRKDKLDQLRNEMDTGSTTAKMQQMKVYLKLVDEKLKVEEKKVHDQKELVKTAEKNLELAKADLQKKRVDVDKLFMHRKDWEREKRKELEIIEARDQDELGTTIHAARQRKDVGNNKFYV